MLINIVFTILVLPKQMKKFISQIFQDENGQYSSNRFVGIMCSLSLCLTLFYSQFNKASTPNAVLIESVALLAFGTLGLGAANKIFKRKE